MGCADLKMNASETVIIRDMIDYYCALKHPPAPFLSFALTGCISRVAQVWCSYLFDAWGLLTRLSSPLSVCD